MRLTDFDPRVVDKVEIVRNYVLGCVKAAPA